MIFSYSHVLQKIYYFIIYFGKVDSSKSIHQNTQHKEYEDHYTTIHSICKDNHLQIYIVFIKHKLIESTAGK
jgi:hypothetical protein